jgi:TorA maturation chaperone TorD
MEKRERMEICDAAQRAFFTEHLAWWLPAFASGLRRKAAGGLYTALGNFLAAFVPLERARWSVAPPRLSVQPQLIERPEEQEACTGCS